MLREKFAKYMLKKKKKKEAKYEKHTMRLLQVV